MKKPSLTVEDVKYYEDEFADLVHIVECFPISMEQIVKAARLLGLIAFQGKFDLYLRILFDGAKD